MLVMREFFLRQVTVVDSIDEVIQDFTHRTLRDADELSKLFVFESGEALSDIAGGGARAVEQLVAKLEIARQFGPLQKLICQQLDLSRSLPRADVTKIPEPSHASGNCNQDSAGRFTLLGV